MRTRTETPQQAIDRHALTGLAGGGPGPAPDGPPMATPERLLGMLAGYQPLQVVATALDLRLPTLIAEGKVDRRALIEATGASARGLGMLLNGLVGLGFLLREGVGDTARYGLAPDAAAFLVEGTPSYLGGYLQFSARRLTEQWRGLTDAVRSGRPAVAMDDPEHAAAYWDEQVDLLFPWNFPLAMHVAGLLRELHPGPAPRLLDVAAGAGVWGIAAAQAHPGMRVVAVDLPKVLERARRNAERFGLGDRFEFKAADLHDHDLGRERYEVAVLGQICHCEGAERSRRLIANAARAVKPGGTIVIVDMLPNEDRSGTVFTLMVALTMLVATSAGDTFTFEEYRNWLTEAGCRDVRPVEAFGQKIVFATRDGSSPRE